MIFMAMALVIALMSLPAGRVEAAPKTIDFATFGTDFFCTGLAVGGGKLFNTGTDPDACNPEGLENLFSFSVCMFENIINDIMGTLYCGMVEAFRGPFLFLLVLATTILGAGILSGIMPVTATQGTVFIFKIALIYAFGFESSFAITILYQGLMGFIQETVAVTMDAFGLYVSNPANPTDSVLRKMDALIGEFVSSTTGGTPDPDNPCAYQLIAIFVAMLAAIPTATSLIAIIAVQFLLLFFKTVIGYLVAITGIMFLLTMSPIFVSLAMFKSTQDYFVKWLHALMAFAIQIFVVFAMIGIVISLDIGRQLRILYEIGVPHQQVDLNWPIRIHRDNWCTICQGKVERAGLDVLYTCDKGKDGQKIPMAPESMTMNNEFFTFFLLLMGKIFFLAYIAESAMGAAPSIARALAGSSYGLTVADLKSTGKNQAFSQEQLAREAREGRATSSSFDTGTIGRRH